MRRFAFLVLLPLLGFSCEDPASVATTAEPVAVPEDAFDEATEQEIVAEVALNAATVIDPAPIDLAPLAVDMTAGNFFFEGERIFAAPGQEIAVQFSHVSGEHTFVIDELDLAYPIRTGTALTFTAPQTPGTYTYYCDTGSHRKLGMEGVLVVE